MSFDQNRRRHERLAMDEDAVALDSSGVELGKVVQAGGGGMTVESSGKHADHLQIGQRTRVTVLEPGSKTQNTIDVVLRRRVGNQLGFEFVTGPSK